MKIFIKVFPTISQSLMGPRKLLPISPCQHTLMGLSRIQYYYWLNL